MNEKKCVLVQSKISVDTAKKLDDIVKEYGFKSRYDIMQYVLSAFLRVVDCSSKASAEDRELVEFARMFEGFESAKNRVITVKPTTSKNMKLVDSINIYSDVGSKGYSCKSLSVRGDDIHTNTSVSKALETVLKRLHKGLYNKLCAIGDAEDERRLERIIEILIKDYHQDDADSAFINQTMQTFDGSPEYGKVPQRRVNRHSYDE